MCIYTVAAKIEGSPQWTNLVLHIILKPNEVSFSAYMQHVGH